MKAGAKYVLIGLALAVGTGGYFLFKKKSEKKTEKEVDDFEETVKSGNTPAIPSSSAPSLPVPAPKPKKPYVPKPANSTLPIKRGSKGPLVKDVQNALVKKYGGSILPKYGADGYYGGELEAALVRKGIPPVINADVYGKIIAGKVGTQNTEAKDPKKPSTNTALSPVSIADLIYSGVVQEDFNTVLRGLFLIGSVNEYIKVNEKFKKKEIHGVRKTVVNAIAQTFTSKYEQEKYKGQFYRIGLKLRGDKWELSGLYGTVSPKVMTIKKTKVWHSSGISMTVPAYTILGTFTRGRNGLTEFRTSDGRKLYVQTIYVKYLNQDDPGD